MSYVHNTVRNFACEICGKAFKTLKDLKIHSTLHTGEKPNICPECGKAFRVRANYFKHRKIHQRATVEQQHQQLQQDQNEGEPEMQSEEQMNTVVMSAPQNGLLDGFHVDSSSVLEHENTPNLNSATAHDPLAGHGTSTISDEGVLLFRAHLPSMNNVKSYPGIND